MQVSDLRHAALEMNGVGHQILPVALFDPNDTGPLATQVAQTLIDLEAEQKIAPVATVDEVRQRYSRPGMFLIFNTNTAGQVTIAVQATVADDDVRNFGELTSGHSSAHAKKANTAHFFSVIKAPGAEGKIFEPFFWGVKKFFSDNHKQVQRAVTFSPIPDYLDWIKNSLDNDFLNSSGAARIFQRDLSSFKAAVGKAKTFADFCSPSIVQDMWRMAAFYLTAGTQGPNGFSALNRVAKTHFSIGGRIDRVIPCADNSADGLTRSGGFMASWQHPLTPEEVKANKSAYRGGRPPESEFIANLKQPTGKPPVAYLNPGWTG